MRPFDDRDRLALIIGRMKNPFWRGSVGTVRTQMLWDDDVNPAGAAVAGQIYKSKSGSYPFTVENTLAYMQIQSLLDTRFVGLTGVVSGVGDQLRFLSKYVDAAVSYYEWWNLNTGLSVPTAQPSQGFTSPQTAASAFLLSPGLQQTNTEVNYGPAGGACDGTPRRDLPDPEPHGAGPHPFQEARCWATPTRTCSSTTRTTFSRRMRSLRKGTSRHPTLRPVRAAPPWPAPAAPRTRRQYDDGVGVTVGARLGDKTYERSFHPTNVWVTYRYVQSDAALSTFADSDLGAGTGYRGFGLGANYRVFKNLMASAQYFDFMGYPLMENHVQRMFLDLMGDF